MLILALEGIGKCSVVHLPGTQFQLNFWVDTWNNDISLKIVYPQLYDICSTKNIYLNEVIQSQGAAVKFRKQFDSITVQEWTSILHIVSTLSFTHTQDKLAWK